MKRPATPGEALTNANKVITGALREDIEDADLYTSVRSDRGMSPTSVTHTIERNGVQLTIKIETAWAGADSDAT